MASYEDILRDVISYIKFKESYSPLPVYGNEVSFTAPAAGGIKQSAYTPLKEQTEFVQDKFMKNKSAKEKTPASMPAEVQLPKNEVWTAARTLEELDSLIQDCKKCRLWKTRTNFVFGTGNPKADIVVIGEAPGAEEDKQGKPFVGRAGQLLTKILEAIELSRDEVFICNVIKSRPPENRNPMPDEIEACEPYLIKQLELIKPKLILALGTFASQTLLRTKLPLGKLRGKFHDYKGVKTMVTFHPAALLRNPGWKKHTWEDVKLLKKEYDNIK